MAYVKKVRYGNTTEVFVYDMSPRPRKRNLVGTPRTTRPGTVRSRRSSLRARTNFLRLVEHNHEAHAQNSLATFTFYRDVTPNVALKLYGKAITEIKKHDLYRDVRTIAVLERTEAGRIHIHALLFGVSAHKRERATRYIQRQFRQGYVDVCDTDGNAKGVAWYMAKYFWNTLTGSDKTIKRAYHCSRDVLRPTTTTFTVLPQVVPYLVPDAPFTDISQYATKYYGSVIKITKSYSQ